MISDELIRTAYYQALAGNITYNGKVLQVADGFEAAESWTDNHIIISTIYGASQNTQTSFIDRVRVTLDIVTYQKNAWSRKPASDIEALVVAALIPNRQSTSLNIAGIQFNDVYRAEYDYITEQSSNGNVVRKLSVISQVVTKS
jgi:hypothetical protein